MEEQEFQPQIGYKIDTKHTYRIYKSENGGRVYYKVQLQKKNYDKSVTKGYRQIKFAQCEPVNDGDIIKINKGFEDFYVKGYDVISIIVVQDYELVENPQQASENAYGEYQDKLNENEVDIDDGFLD